MTTTTILALLCFLGGTGLSIALGAKYGSDWKNSRFGLWRTSCIMAFGSSVLMLAIRNGWLQPGESIVLFLVVLIIGTILGLIATYLIAAIAARLARP